MSGSILIAGGGVMGRGIARLFADAGAEVTLLVRAPGSAALERVRTATQPPPDVPDVVIESVVEELPVKRSVFERLQRTYGARPVYASNTSGLSLDAIAAGMPHPERIAGMHFFQPAELFPMVEVIRATATSADAFDALVALCRSAKREPIPVERPVIGAVINRLQHSILHEAYHLLQSGVATPATIDAVAKHLLGPRMCVTGLLEQKDLGGLKMHADAQRSLVPSLTHTGVPAPILQEMVARGDLGARTGRGFYDWSGVDVDALTERRRDELAQLLAYLDTSRDERAERARTT